MSLVGEQLPVWGLLEARYCARESATVWVHQFEELTRDETQALQEHRGTLSTLPPFAAAISSRFFASQVFTRSRVQSRCGDDAHRISL